MLNDSDRLRAGLLLLALGLLLAVALAPFATGLVAIPVLYVILQPANASLMRRLPARGAAALTTLLALVLVITPAVVFGIVVLRQAGEAAAQLAEDPLMARLEGVTIGPFNLGRELATLSSSALSWLGGSALGLIGSATRQVLNLVIALFGLYYLLLRPAEIWHQFSGWLPFAPATIENLRNRFRDLTTSTIIGTGLVAAVQGLLVGAALGLTGVPNALFWGMVTVVLSILPVVGSGLVWAPAALWLASHDRTASAVGLALWGLLIVGNMDFFIRPAVSRRWAHVHPLITLVGALAGVRYFGLLGLLIGPLALSYFFALLNAYRSEYAVIAAPAAAPPKS